MGTKKLGRITTSGTITEYSTSAEFFFSNLAVGPDGNVWYTTLNSMIGNIAP